jgi:hypothetical protein
MNETYIIVKGKFMKVSDFYDPKKNEEKKELTKKLTLFQKIIKFFLCHTS